MSTASVIAAAFSLGSLSFSSQNIKSTKLTLTPHHLHYLLAQIEELGIEIGPMNVRLENIHADASPANYVSFLSQAQRPKGRSRSDRDSTHSVSSVRSVMSGMSNLWSGFGLGSSNATAKTEKARAQFLADLKYLYSAFTKIPCLRLSPNHNARLIGGYEEFPFDTAVPLLAFKNVSALEISDVDFRQFYGWDKLADQLRSLSVKRATMDDLSDLLIGIVLDDMDKRRRRSSKVQLCPILPWPASPYSRFGEFGRANSTPSSPVIDDRYGHSTSPKNSLTYQRNSESSIPVQRCRTKSVSPTRPGSTSRLDGLSRSARASTPKFKRSGSGSSNSSGHSSGPFKSGSSSNLLSMGMLPATKWRFLRHLSIADNSLTYLTTSSLTPLAGTLHSLDISSNLFTEMPDSLASLVTLRALNASNCMIESLHSLTRFTMPAITTLNLRANRLNSLAGVERLQSLERLDLRENKMQDPTELARLTGMPRIHEIWVLRNPLVKAHSTYRATIFNLFRSIPGKTEDVVLDGSGPSYSEKRQLRERIVDPEGVTVVEPLPVEALLGPSPETRSSLEEPTKMITTPPRNNLRRPLSQHTQSEVAIGSARRRKGPRRRIVDLARDGSPPILHQMSMGTRVVGLHPDIEDGSVLDNPPESKQALLLPFEHKLGPRLSASQYYIPPTPESSVEVSSRGHTLVNEIQTLDLGGEVYRQKVQALKDEVGSNWLSVLNAHGWAEHMEKDDHDPRYIQSGRTNSNVQQFPASQAVLSGQRSLG